MGLNLLMEIVIMEQRQFYREHYSGNYYDEKYIEQATQEFVAMDRYVVFGERYGNELVLKLKEIGGTRTSLWYEKDPALDNDCLFSENIHMYFTRYSSKTLLMLAKMSSDTTLIPRYTTLFSGVYDNKLPTTGDDISQTMLREAIDVDLDNHNPTYMDGCITKSVAASYATGKRKESTSTSTSASFSPNTTGPTYKRETTNVTRYTIKGKYSRNMSYQVVFRDGKKNLHTSSDTKRSSKNLKAQLATTSQALIRFFVNAQVLDFFNQDLSTVTIVCDNTKKVLSGTLHCYHRIESETKPMIEVGSERSDNDDDEESGQRTFKFTYSNIDNCYEWKIALLKSQNDIYLQTEMVADIVGCNGTSMKPWVTFPILPLKVCSNDVIDVKTKRSCIEEDR